MSLKHYVRDTIRLNEKAYRAYSNNCSREDSIIKKAAAAVAPFIYAKLHEDESRLRAFNKNDGIAHVSQDGGG